MAKKERELTQRQTDVLRLHRAGKGPTEIGNELGISAQGVHGHFRRLREKGLMEPVGRGEQASVPKRVAIDASSALGAVRQAAEEQREAIRSRQSAIAGEIEALQAEERELLDALHAIDGLLDTGESGAK